MQLHRTQLQRFLIAVLVLSTAAWAQPAQQTERRQNQDPTAEQDMAKLLSQAFRNAARKVKPAVVQVNSIVEVQGRSGRRQQGIDPRQLPEPFREFFEEYQMPQEPQPQRGRGSGVIIDAEQGYILTNNHVVGGEALQVSNGETRSRDGERRSRVRLDVILDNGRQVQANVVGQDPKTDIALIQIAEADMKRLKEVGVTLESVPIGDSRKMEVGDWVLAIGAPFGLAQSVTQGIISATGRSNVGIVGIEDFIQTDAAINPGNSGGPLVNMRGELIGINTAIATSGLTRGYMGIGFAIPTAMIQQILPDLREGREIVRGYLGVGIRDLKQTPGLARTFGLQDDRGILIEEVRPDTPASKAGLKAEDVILGVGDTDIESVPQLQNLVARTKPGETLDVVVWRDGKSITIPVTIEAQPEDFYTARIPGRDGRGTPEEGQPGAETEIPSVGMSVSRMTPELAQQHGWEYEEVQGQVIVTSVDQLGEAGALRISEGDIIVSIQGRAVKSPAALKEALSADALAQGVRMRVKSQMGTRTLLLQVSP